MANGSVRIPLSQVSERVRVDAAYERGGQACPLPEVWLEAAETDLRFRFQDGRLGTVPTKTVEEANGRQGFSGQG